MSIVRLELPDTPATRAMLRDLAVHAVDDNAAFFEAEAEEPGCYGYLGAVPAAEMAEACRAFDAAVTEALGGVA